MICNDPQSRTKDHKKRIFGVRNYFCSTIMKFALLCAALYLLLFHSTNAELHRNPPNIFENMLVRLNDGISELPLRHVYEGRVEISLDKGTTWGTICSTEWSLREGNVICRELGIGYADIAVQSTKYGDSQQYPWKLLGTMCRGNEKKLAHCFRETSYPALCNANYKQIATLKCVPQSPDLQLALVDIERSVRLDIVPMSQIACAMEENCVSKDAYEIRKTNPEARRSLLRFTTRAENVGNADFSPYANFREWEWHQCHRHYHSMKVFATFDVYDSHYTKVAQGHKASFCLMDSACRPGIRPKYTCGNTTQGISIGCSDTYGAGLDCQWVDVTNLQRNRNYILRVAVNPEYRIGEISFENNGAECDLSYTGESSTTRITKCKPSPLWFRKTTTEKATQMIIG